jgi:hypothetical protein
MVRAEEEPEMSRRPQPTLRRRVEISAESIAAFLASDAGRLVRRVVAGTVLLTLPFVLRMPVVRRHPLLRWLELLGGAALVVKLAEALRDWEPGTRVVIDVDA